MAPLIDLISLDGMCAIVTGAARGFGFACADRLSEAGASVVLADLKDSGVREAGQRLAASGRTAFAVTADISRENNVDDLVSATIAQFGRIDILVNNAGVYSYFPLEDLAFDEFRRIINVNLFGAFLCTKAVARPMKQQANGGSIINISSNAAVRPTYGLAHYDASKHAIWGLTKTTAVELGRHGIRVNAIAPGSSLTEGAREYLADRKEGDLDSARGWQERAARIPLGRLCDPDDVGRVAVFLASSLASYVNGVQIVVDGGDLLLDPSVLLS